MKHLFLILTICTFGFAAEEKKPEPIVVNSTKPAATYDQTTGEWKLEKGAKAEDVMTSLLRDVANLQNALQKCESEKTAAPAKKSK